MKKILTLFIALSLVLCACSSKEEKNSDEVQVEKELFDVTITIPASWYESTGAEISQEDLDEQYSEEGYKSATLNEDGSVTIVMSKSQHKKLMEEIEDGIVSSIKELVDDSENSISKIEHNDDFTKFTVTLSADEVGIVEGFAVLALNIYGGMYHVFNGTNVDNIKTVFYNSNGSIIEEYNSSEMGE